MSDCCDTGAGRNENIKGCALPGYPGCTLAHHNHSVNVLIFLYLDSETSNEISFASRRWSPPIRDFSIIQNSTHWGPATSHSHSHKIHLKFLSRIQESGKLDTRYNCVLLSVEYLAFFLLLLQFFLLELLRSTTVVY